LLEDDHLIVVDKPGGLLTVATDRDRPRTAYRLLNEYVRRGRGRSRTKVHIVHRLDRETSGVLVFAKSREAKFALQERWGETKKTYLAVVRGVPAEREGVITSLLAENAAHHVYTTDDRAKGREATTAYRVLKRTHNLALLEVDLVTGRKHQIRVHFADAGNPVIGDERYGPEDPSQPQLALHAWKISFDHPAAGGRISIEAPVPGFFRGLVGTWES
jgi:RluA family pseudouridine synthase